MKLKIIFIFMLSALLIFIGIKIRFGEIKTDATNCLKITLKDKKVIQKYCDEKTDDIAHSTEGKMYSAFKLLGTDKGKIYIWLIKKEYYKSKWGNKIIDGDAVSLPVVLYVKKNKEICISKHKYPPDGQNNGKSIQRLFPPNIRNAFPQSDIQKLLLESTFIRAEKDLRKNNDSGDYNV